MKSYVTSYYGLFAHNTGDTPQVTCIEIPLIQRDYAQGRDSEGVKRIRDNFLDKLHEALTTSESLSLDFVYGDVIAGTLRPLDGQQRLTTLFLLHWYVAWRAERLDDLCEESGWKRFEYATRPCARLFCKQLVKSKPAAGERLRTWFEDQPWFLHTWQRDPTIQSMLVMLEAIDERFTSEDCAAAWVRLVDPVAPGISFHLLPIERMGLSEDLYIKMNSRGKPLTRFENFKAGLEQLLEHSCPSRLEEFAQKVDGAWADLLWPFRGEDDLIDDELMRYFEFVTEVCTWRDGDFLIPSESVESMAERVYGTVNENAAEHVDFLIRSLDAWVGADIEALFSEILSLVPAAIDADPPERVVIFGPPGSRCNLFAEVCSAQVRRTAPRTLLLYAVLLHRLHGSADFMRRLRVLRNLIEASSSEIRADRMPALIADVRHLIVNGRLDGIEAFNQAQVADEKLKVELIAATPSLERHLLHLEDHPLLRGCLAAFDLDASTFERRAHAFHDLFDQTDTLTDLTGALLAAGDYALRPNQRFHQFASSSDRSQWREEFFAIPNRAHLAEFRAALGTVLDAVATRTVTVQSALLTFAQGWLDDVGSSGRKDWRWYFVRYPEMRAGRSGIYASVGGRLGYSVCMLDKKAVSSYYRDPYLAAIRTQSAVDPCTVQGPVPHPSGEPGFTGYETEERWMRLVRSGTEMRIVGDGLQMRAPPAPQHAASFASVCNARGVSADLHLPVAQETANGRQVDIEDRVQLGAALLRDLVAAGL